MRGLEGTAGVLSLWKRFGPLALGCVAWLAVLPVAVSRARDAAATPAAGLDLVTIRDTGTALRGGHSIYSLPAFIYPPPASLLGWLESFVSAHTDIVAYSYFEVAAIIGTVFVFRRCLRPERWCLVASGLLAILLLKGDLVVGLLWLDNASLLLLLPFALLLVLWGRDRWNPGAVVFAITILVKPVLLPVVVVPLVFRRWTALLVTAAVASIGLVLSVALSGSSGSIATVVRRLSDGATLVGTKAAYNVSVVGVQHLRHLNVVLVSATRVAIVLIAALVVYACARRRIEVSLVSVGALATLVLCTVFLAGPLSEVHYLPFLLPGAMIMVSGNSRPARYLLVGALAVSAYSAYYFGGAGSGASAVQLRCVAVQLLVFAASALVAMAVSSEVPEADGISRSEETPQPSTV